MTVPKKIFFFSGILALLLMVGLFFFVFNPLGLGPEPATVLSPEFFENPAQDLSELELLIDGKEAFNEIFAAIDSAESSVYIQTYIWKDDSTGQAVVAKLKAAADRGVRVTVSKDMLGTFFELGDMIKGKPSPVFTKTGLKGHQNIQVDTDLFADTDHSKYYIFDERNVIFGGMNIADEYHLQWHDYMVLLRGKIWTEAFTNKVLKQLPWPPASALVLTVNNSKETEIRTATVEIIENATQSVVIEHAYFSDDKVIEAVKRAAARGVRVEVILPKIPDTHLYANMATINRLLDAESGKVPRVLLYPAYVSRQGDYDGRPDRCLRVGQPHSAKHAHQQGDYPIRSRGFHRSLYQGAARATRNGYCCQRRSCQAFQARSAGESQGSRGEIRLVTIPQKGQKCGRLQLMIDFQSTFSQRLAGYWQYPQR